MSKTASQRRRELTQCALCTAAPSSPEGEHVLPRALKRYLFPESKGPYTTSSAAGEVKRRQFDSVKLACCVRCNNILQVRFESRGRLAAQRLLSEEVPNLTRGETWDAVLWFIKTWLLWLHPRTEFTDSFPRPSPTRPSPPQHLYSWLVNDQPPPSGLSAWGFLHDQSDGGPRRGEVVPRLELPIVDTGQGQIPFVHLDLTLALVDFTLIYHPDWPIRYDPALDGRVQQLWPLPEGLTIQALPRLTRRPLKFGPMPRLQFLPGRGLGEEPLPALTPDVPIHELVRDRLLYFAI
jgi:hypothetical protein